MIILFVAVATAIAAIAFGASIKKLPTTETRKIDGYKAATALSTVGSVLAFGYFGYRWYQRNPSAIKDRLPPALKGGAYQRY